nr:hypothetical protein [Tanacetum cinerariifolium]
DNPQQDLKDKGVNITRKDFKLTDESHVLLKVPRKDNINNVYLKNVVPHRENLIDLRVKVIRCDNGTEFKNMVMNQFYEMKDIKREFSIARTPQQNRAKAVNTACYVQNRVLVIKPHNRTPYELFLGRKSALSFMRPFGYPVTILNTIDHIGNQSNGSAGTKTCDNVGKTKVETIPDKYYILLPLWTQDLLFSSSLKESPGAGFKPSGDEEKKDVEDPGNEDSEDNAVDENIVHGCADDLNIPDLEEIGRFSDAVNNDSRADMNNLDTYF